jgi:pimeloyl-ACP methyl ester carboxylesterase
MQMVLSIAGLAAALVAAGALYQWIGSLRDRRLYAVSGRWVRVSSGCRLFLLQEGTGSPTVLFEAGIAATHLNWRHIQEEISRSTGTLSYDRGGLGWSSRCRTGRTPTMIAAELHDLLEGAGSRPPYILVGHSFGGLVMRRYALLYPQEVAGIVLVDPMRCEEWPPLDPSKQSQIDLGRKLIRFATPIAGCGLARLALSSMFRRSGRLSGGLAAVAGGHTRHVLRRVTSEVRKMPCKLWPVVAAQWSRPGFYSGMRKHLESIPATVEEMHEAEPIQEIPVMVLTPGKAAPLTKDDLRRIGKNVRQVIAPASAHWIHLDEPHLVVASILEMLEPAKAESLAAGL